MSFIKRFHKSALLGIIFVVFICSIIVILYPKEISFDKDILDKHVKGNVNQVRITRWRDDATNITKWITNKDDVSKIIQELSKIKMIKCKKDSLPSVNYNNSYDIGISTAEEWGIVCMTIYNGDNDDYITLFINSSYSSKIGTYKILKGSLDMNYIKSLVY